MMGVRKVIKKYAESPLPHQLVLDILKDYKRPNDKVSELMKQGDLVSVRKGLYLPGPNLDMPLPEPLLIANHLRGPSYVSLESALSYWGLIPERTFEVSSITTKTSKKYKTVVGRYSYRQLPTPYYSYGIKRVSLTSKQSVLIASAEKALCDKIVLTRNLNLRSIRQTRDFLEEDLRIEYESLEHLDTRMIETWIEHAPKQGSIAMLVKTLDRLW